MIHEVLHMASHALQTVIEKMTIDLVRHHPRALILFGSAVRYQCGIQKEAPEDIDMLYVGTIKPMHTHAYRIPWDLFFFEEHEIVSIARSLRYSPKPMARAKMFFKDTWKGYVRSDIVSCLLLGSGYTDYGFLQMEDEEQPRDYSIHDVLYGEPWWRALQHYAQEHRGLKGLGIDKVLGLDQFDGAG
jgi:hypothetical protein